MNTERRVGILIAVDDSDAARRTLRHVADIVGARRRFRVHLLHLLPPLPPDTFEHPGAESPGVERELEHALERRHAVALADCRAKAEPLLRRAAAVLTEAGFAADAIETECRETVDRVAVARECLDAARESRCETIAIGRTSLPWYRELFHRHAAVDLAQHADDVNLWIVG